MTTQFGAGLRHWRSVRGMSQVDLAGAATVSQRHISFLETGRSRPSRDMVLHLGRALDVSPREQNVLLAAAGHAPAFPETPWERLGEVRAAIEAMLRSHEPNMAMALDRRWDVVAANDAVGRVLARALPDPPPWFGPTPNLMRIVFHPDGLRRSIVEWGPTAAALLTRLRRDVASHPSDGDLRLLLREIESCPGAADLAVDGAPATVDDPLLSTTCLVDGEPVSLFATIAVIGDAHDLTLSELRIAAFWPVDRASAEVWRRAVGA